MTGRQADYTRAQAVANGALEIAYKRWQAYMQNNQSGTLSLYTTTASWQAATGPAPLSLMNQVSTAVSASGFKVTELSIASVDRTDSVQGDKGEQGPTGGSIAPLANVPGWIATTYNYRARAVVQKITDPSMIVSVSRYFQQADASLFQAMLFFNDDLELHPGPAMTLFGPVHTNGNLYAVAGSGGSLNFESNVSYAGANNPYVAHFNPATPWLYKYSNTNTSVDPGAYNANGYAQAVTGTLDTTEKSQWTDYTPPTYTGTGGRSSELSNTGTLSPLGQDDSVFIAGNQNATSSHEIIERPVPLSQTNPSADPSVADPGPIAAHRLFNGAGLRIFINHTTAYSTSTAGAAKVHVYSPDPSNPENSIEIVPASPPFTGANQPNIANQVIAAITPSTGNVTPANTASGGVGEIQDFREGHYVNVDTVDLASLTPTLNAYSGYNGVVYVTDITNTTSADAYSNTSNVDAIRLKNGGVLPDAGLSLVTDGALYVQGDYNSGPTLPPTSNAATSSSTQFTATGYTQKPAAVMGDAVMILSNNWVDANSSGGSATSVATLTTFNAAIVSGAVLTTSTTASGGAHNFPRFLENWSGVNFTYHGSMCELYTSIHFTGTYGKNNVYSPPNRHWFFDNSFLTSPPPGNLRTTTYARGRWVRNGNS